MSGKRFPWGNAPISHNLANFWNDGGEPYQTGSTGPHPVWSNNNDQNYPYTSPVGSFAPNGYGLYDMGGTCGNGAGIGSIIIHRPRKLIREVPTTGSNRVIRGGSWDYYARGTRCAYRDYGWPDYGIFLIGFRLARGQP